MTNHKNVGWIRPEAVTHQDKATGQDVWPALPIEQIADVNPRLDKSVIADDLPVSFVPMPAVGAGDGSIHVDESRPAREVKKGFTAFLEGDVLFAKITPCMENGKMAVVPKLVNGYGFGSTEFHVLRPKAGIDAKYLYYYVSSQSFRGEAERYMTGAVGQKRVSTTYLKEATIPVAPPRPTKTHRRGNRKTILPPRRSRRRPQARQGQPQALQSRRPQSRRRRPPRRNRSRDCTSRGTQL